MPTGAEGAGSLPGLIILGHVTFGDHAALSWSGRGPLVEEKGELPSVTPRGSDRPGDR